MNALRTLWTTRIVTVFAVACVTVGAVASPVDEMQQEERAAGRAEDDTAAPGQAAAPVPVAPLHIVRLAGVPAATQVLPAHRASNNSAPQGTVGTLSNQADCSGPFAACNFSGTRSAIHRSVYFLHGIVWPMGP